MGRYSGPGLDAIIAERDELREQIDLASKLHHTTATERDAAMEEIRSLRVGLGVARVELRRLRKTLQEVPLIIRRHIVADPRAGAYIKRQAEDVIRALVDAALAPDTKEKP